MEVALAVLGIDRERADVDSGVGQGAEDAPEDPGFIRGDDVEFAFLFDGVHGLSPSERAIIPDREAKDKTFLVAFPGRRPIMALCRRPR
jgi:hypothetical protein